MLKTLVTVAYSVSNTKKSITNTNESHDNFVWLEYRESTNI